MNTGYFGSNNELNIVNIVFFSLINKNTNGGAIFINDKTVNIIIDYCTIFNCSSLYECGGIFSSTNSAILRCLCLSLCSGQNYASLLTETNSAANNIFIFSTILQSLNNNGYTCSIKDGIQSVSYINSTKNYNQASAIMLYFARSLSTASYCSIINNREVNGQIFENSDGESSVSNFNIVNNTSLNGPNGVVSIWRATTLLKETIILDNKEFKWIFYFYSGTLEALSCYIQEVYESHKSNTENSLTISGSFLYLNAINFFQTFLCAAEIFSTEILYFTYGKGTPTLPTKLILPRITCNHNNIHCYFIMPFIFFVK